MLNHSATRNRSKDTQTTQTCPNLWGAIRAVFHFHSDVLLHMGIHRLVIGFLLPKTTAAYFGAREAFPARGGRFDRGSLFMKRFRYFHQIFLHSNLLITGSYGGPTWRPRSSYSSTSCPYPGSTKSWRWRNSGLGTTPFPGPSFRPWYTETSRGQGQGQWSTSSSSYCSYWLLVS